MNTDKKIYLGVCLNGFTAPAFIISLLHSAKVFPFEEISLHPGNTQLFMARNEITAGFLRSDCTHLMFIDSDLIFSERHLKRLTSHHVDIVAGMYPCKEDGPLRVAVDDYHESRPIREDGLQSVRHVATGFMLIARRVFERMIKEDGDKIAFKSDFPPHIDVWNFWRAEVVQGRDRKRYLTEDWTFCHRWLELGGEVFVDRTILLRHVGVATYPLKSQLAANPDNSPA